MEQHQLTFSKIIAGQRRKSFGLWKAYRALNCYQTTIYLWSYILFWIWCMFVRASLYMRREDNLLDATEWLIALIIYSTCFGHLYAHHQELETILVLLPHMVCNVSVAGGRRSGAGQQAMCPGWGKLLEQLPSTRTHSSWWWAYKCPKHVEQITSAINHSVALSWFSSLRIYSSELHLFIAYYTTL